MEDIELAENPKGWKSTSRKNLLENSTSNAKCTTCMQVFSTARNFDSHRKWNSNKKASYCTDPSSVKLMLSDKRIWITEQVWFDDQPS